MASKTTHSNDTKTLVTVLCLLFVFPIGVIVMWVWSGWKTWVKVLITILFIIFAVLPILFVISYAYFLRPFQINGQGMHPNFQNGEYVSSQVYNQGLPLQRGSVVIYSTNPQSPYQVKRVIGLPGETISIMNSQVYINGEKLDESPYISSDVQTLGGSFLKDEESVLIPDNSYFLMGDNRSFSSDSRNEGFINEESIVAIPKFCYWNCK